MEPVSFIVFTACLIGAGYTSYKCGERDGISNCLDWLEEEGYITFTEE
jgi:hypothetical protein